MTLYRAILADDEHSARELLKESIALHPDLVLEAQCHNAADLLSALESIKPDLVFLDIDLGDMTGFDVLRTLPAIDFEVIFITGFDQYAQRAFELAASDYLLKPFSPEQFAIAIERFRHRKQTKTLPGSTEVLLNNTTRHNPLEERIIITTTTGQELVTIGDIIMCESSGAFTTFFVGDEQHISTRSMKECDKLLSPYGFMRVNQTQLVNQQYIKRIMKRSKTLELNNKRVIEVSRHFEKDLLGRWKVL